MIAIYYSNSNADFADYLSETTVFFAIFCTLFSIIGLHLRPDLYEIFRKSFFHNDSTINLSITKPNQNIEIKQTKSSKLT